MAAAARAKYARETLHSPNKWLQCDGSLQTHLPTRSSDEKRTAGRSARLAGPRHAALASARPAAAAMMCGVSVCVCAWKPHGAASLFFAAQFCNFETRPMHHDGGRRSSERAMLRCLRFRCQCTHQTEGIYSIATRVARAQEAEREGFFGGE